MFIDRLPLPLLVVVFSVAAACTDDEGGGDTLDTLGATDAVTTESDAPTATDTTVVPPADTAATESTPSDTTPLETSATETFPHETFPHETTPTETFPHETTPTETTPTDTTATDTATGEVNVTPAPILLSITLHLENSTFNAAYFASLDSFAKSVEAHGGRLTFEPREPVVTAAAGPPQLFDWRTLEGRGHSIGSHAAIGGTNAMSLSTFTAQAKMRYDQLVAKVDVLEHISGNCGNVDWVTGVTTAGFQATTAATVLCLLSIPSADRPAEYRDLACDGATDPVCHRSYPSALADRIHPWRAKDGAHWLTHDDTGPLVIFPGSGTLPCLDEEATNPGGSLPSCTFDQADITRAMADLDGAIALADPSKVNTFYWVWGSWKLSAAEEPVLEAFLDAVDARIALGQVEWANLHDMLTAFKTWENATP